MANRTPRILLSAALAASVLMVGCSKDSKEESSEVSSEYEKLCEAAREGQNATTSEQLASAEAQMAAAPEELQADFQLVIDFVKYRDETPADAAGIQERSTAMQPAFQRLLKVIEAECGFNPFQF